MHKTTYSICNISRNRRKFTIPELYDTDGQRLYLTQDERRAFYDAAMDEDRKVRTFCHTLHDTGVRISEALVLRPSKVDLSEQALIIRSLKKRGKIMYRAIPVQEGYLDTLDLVHNIREAQKRKKIKPLWGWSRMHAWRLVKGVMDKAGIDTALPHATPKGLRHGFAIYALSKDVPLNMVSKWLGHADVKTTSIYVNAVGVEQRDFAERMWS